MASKSKPEVWERKSDGQTRLVRSVDDRVKAKFDGFRKAADKKSPAPHTTNDSTK